MSNDHVRIERRYAHPIERVWRAVTEADELAEGFVVRPGWKPELGETWHVMGQDGRIGPAEPHERGWTAYFARLEAHLAGGHLTEEEAHALL